jgi:hypothetical protein
MENTALIQERTTERDIEKGTRFLRTLSHAPHIFALLSERAGYTEADHNQGWQTLLILLGSKATVERKEPAAAAELPGLSALAALSDYDGSAFRRTRSALENRYADQTEYLLGGLTPSEGALAVGTVSTFLDRWVALREGTDASREGKRVEDREAAQLLVSRRIVDDEIEATLREHIRNVQVAPPVVSTVEPKATPEYQQAVRDFHVWLRDWRAQAREVIERRDYLIRLGLAARRQGESDDVGEETESGEEVAAGA